MSKHHKANRYLREQKRKTLFSRQNGLCFWCGDKCRYFIVTKNNKFHKRLNKRLFTLDHLLQLSRGGSDEDRNLVGACSYCNSRRENFKLRDWLIHIRKNNALKIH